MNDVAASTEIYQFRVVVRDTSPHLWRRLRVNSNISLPEFHHTLEVAFGWSGSRPYRFFIRGEAHEINPPDGQNEVDQFRLADFHFLPNAHHDHFGIAITMPRNPQPSSRMTGRSRNKNGSHVSNAERSRLKSWG